MKITKSKVHTLKIFQRYLDALLEGRKTCEIRFDDRDYQCGDVLKFTKYDQSNIDPICLLTDKYLGISEERFYFRITHIANFIGLKKQYVCLSVKQIKESEV